MCFSSVFEPGSFGCVLVWSWRALVFEFLCYCVYFVLPVILKLGTGARVAKLVTFAQAP